MWRAKTILIAVALLSAIIFTSCQKEPLPVESNQDSNQIGLSKFSLPPGATLVSATFNVYVIIPTSQDINLHRITVPWDEMVVTWNNFGGSSSYSPAIEGTFNAAAETWYSVDVTSLVGSWLDGTYPNYGLLLDQVDQNYPRTRYWAKEGWHNHPYLQICYMDGGTLVCENIEPLGDTYIYQLDPDGNFGDYPVVYTGWLSANDLEKQALFQFDIEYVPYSYDCETAYAYGGNDVFAQCFIGLQGVNSNNWGWSNHITDVSTDFSYEWPIYAGAAQCDISGASLVGTVTVDYNATTDCVTLTWDLDPAYTLDSYHLWIDNDEPLPQKNNGNYITAPGQFNHNGETVVCNLDEPFWIAIHWGVCHYSTQ